MNKKYTIIILISALLILILVAGGYFLRKNKKPAPSIEPAVSTEELQKTVESVNEKATQGVLPDVYAPVNPLENVPDANPYTETNPFSEVKVNPFE